MREPRLTVGSLVPNASLTSFTRRNTVTQVKQVQVNPVKEERPKRTATIKLLQNNKVYKVQPTKGKLLLDAALQQGQNINYKCRKGTCGACTVKVEEGGAYLSPVNDKEQKKLTQSTSNSYRLACQAMIQ